MTDKKPILEGDLVTINLSEYQAVSNTYQVKKKLEGQSILSHPLAPDCLIIKDDTELNNAFPSMQSQIEKCLFFAKKKRDVLGHTMAEDLEALCFYFVIRKDFSQKQRHDLSNICGKIASVVLGNVSTAVTTIKQNKSLLDEQHYGMMNSIKAIIDNPLTLRDRRDKFKIFNIAGFILAQLSNS